jgi:hypothetical protein
MKKIILTISLLAGLVSNAQDAAAPTPATDAPTSATEFTLTPERFTDNVVIQVPNKTQAELFKKTLEFGLRSHIKTHRR